MYRLEHFDSNWELTTHLQILNHQDNDAFHEYFVFITGHEWRGKWRSLTGILVFIQWLYIFSPCFHTSSIAFSPLNFLQTLSQSCFRFADLKFSGTFRCYLYQTTYMLIFIFDLSSFDLSEPCKVMFLDELNIHAWIDILQYVLFHNCFDFYSTNFTDYMFN